MSPIRVPQVGRPETKLLVPSIGSRTQTYSASGRSRPYSSPITPWAGNVWAISRRMAASAPRSASVTGSNTPPPDLSSARIALRKNGRITSPDTCASRSTKAAKSTAVIQRPHKRVKRHASRAYLLSEFVIVYRLLISAISFYTIDRTSLFAFARRVQVLNRNATVPRIQWATAHRTKKRLATAAVSTDIVAVRHDLPHMPSLGVSSLDSRPPWRHGGLLFCRFPRF